MSRGRDTYRREELLARLTPAQRYSWDALLTNRQIAAWLGKPPTSLQRYRRDSFPRPCGLLSSRGKRGGRNLDYKGRPRRRTHKGVPGWRPSAVLSWLAQTGRLEA